MFLDFWTGTFIILNYKCKAGSNWLNTVRNFINQWSQSARSWSWGSIYQKWAFLSLIPNFLIPLIHETLGIYSKWHNLFIKIRLGENYPFPNCFTNCGCSEARKVSGQPSKEDPEVKRKKSRGNSARPILWLKDGINSNEKKTNSTKMVPRLPKGLYLEEMEKTGSSKILFQTPAVANAKK